MKFELQVGDVGQFFDPFNLPEGTTKFSVIRTYPNWVKVRFDYGRHSKLRIWELIQDSTIHRPTRDGLVQVWPEVVE